MVVTGTANNIFRARQLNQTKKGLFRPFKFVKFGAWSKGLNVWWTPLIVLDVSDYLLQLSFMKHNFFFSYLKLAGPKLTKVPDRFLLVSEGTVASVTCEAFSYPPSVVTWTRALGTLPKWRSSVNDGVLTIQDFSVTDTGTYVCTASNKMGSVAAVTTLVFQRKIRKIGGGLKFFLFTLIRKLFAHSKK